MTNKIQGTILLAAAVLVIISDRFSEDAAIIIAAVALVGMAVWEFLEKDKNNLSAPAGHLPSRGEKEAEPINPEQVKQRQEHLQKILEMVKGKEQITNDEVEKALGVSDSTATRYLQELAIQGKLIQIGSRGHQVEYKIP